MAIIKKNPTEPYTINHGNQALTALSLQVEVPEHIARKFLDLIDGESEPRAYGSNVIPRINIPGEDITGRAKCFGEVDFGSHRKKQELIIIGVLF